MAGQTDVREIGIPVRTVRNGTLMRGVGRDGEECLYAVMRQNGEGVGTFFVQIDLETGETQRMDMPANLGNGPVLWSDHWQRLFVFAGVEFSNKGNLVQLDPKVGRIEDLGEVPVTGSSQPVSMDEAPDGTIYMGTFGSGCSLASYRPDTGAFTDHGVVDPQRVLFLCPMRRGRDGRGSGEDDASARGGTGSGGGSVSVDWACGGHGYATGACRSGEGWRRASLH